jgi:uncharacterized membrane protein YGL010W
MSPVAQYLARYGEYHRDRRNVATHIVGIPMIVLAVEVLLSGPLLSVADTPVNLALLASVAAALFYLRLDLRLGLVMSAFLALCAWIGSALAALPTGHWLGWGAGLFVVGWAIQFVGHYFEGRKPAFLDDIKSLLIGPLFVSAELAFMLGLRRELQAAITPR